jgi:AcrR family transcriptional regulator
VIATNGGRHDDLDRRNQAIQHGADLLRDGGPSALTSVAVAERMGITQPGVYRHIRDIDELKALASEVVVADINASLRQLLLSPRIDWDRIDDIRWLCRSLIDRMVAEQQAFSVVDRWRFDASDLGAGIRALLNEGRDLVAFLLESRWRIEWGYEGPLDHEQRTVLLTHAQLIHDDGLAAARLARTSDNDSLRDDLGDVLRYRLIAGWASFVIDMNDRVGLPFPTIELDDRIFDE